MSITRNELYVRFGPQLLEALTNLMFGEINILRKQLNLPLRTKQQLINTLSREWLQTSKYSWMDDGDL